MIRLPKTKEPIHIKEMAQRGKLGTDWDIDSLVAWFGNSLPKYLWTNCGWSEFLKEAGFSWQNFLRILSFHKREIIRWLRNDLAWNDFIKSLEESISGEIGRLVRRRMIL